MIIFRSQITTEFSVYDTSGFFFRRNVKNFKNSSNVPLLNFLQDLTSFLSSVKFVMPCFRITDDPVKLFQRNFLMIISAIKTGRPDERAQNKQVELLRHRSK
ncbi:MAG: hypothetical protein N2654_05020 [Deltaproteobacteria bacterium]|nr:hypothetical protein [Deltaproteobacteria bacterium]